MPDNILPFIESVTSHIKEHPLQGRLLAVVPTRRSATFLRRSFDRAGIQARILTIDNLAKTLSPLEQAGKITALMTLRQAYAETMRREMTLDETFGWGETLLSDIEAIQHAGHKDPEEVIKKALAAKKTSDTAAEALTAISRTIGAFEDKLMKRGLGTAAMLQRQAAAASKTMLHADATVLLSPVTTSPVTEAMLASLEKDMPVRWYWDFAGEAATDPEGPAAALVEPLIARHPAPEGFTAPARDIRSQKWHVVHVPSNTGQARAMAAALTAKDIDPEDTAVILTDESLLIPVLDAMPEAVPAVNVTMGYPVEDGAAASLSRLLTTILDNMRDDKVGYKALRAYIRHPYVKKALGDTYAVIEDKLRSEGLTQVDATAYAALHPAVEAALKKDTTPYGQLAAVAGTLAPYLNDFEKALLETVTDTAREISEAVPDADTGTWDTLMARCLRHASIPFEGEPLRGLQVTGPMEVRCLDFGTVIYLSAGEGQLPAPRKNDSLLPPDLRHTLGMAPADTREKLSTYGFWSSTCRASDIWLIHDCRTGGMSTGEETRFAKQLRLLYGADVEDLTATQPMREQKPAQARKVDKDDSVMQRLRDLYVNGRGAFSATALNTYLDCRLRFWYAYVLGVKERQDIVETLDAALFGTIYHAVMENLYKDAAGKTLSAQDIHAMRNKEDLEAQAERAFRENGVPKVQCANTILKDVIISLADKTLETDEASAPLTILGTEKAMQMHVEIPGTGKVRIYGLADRIDKPSTGEHPRIIDYKTGLAKGKDDTGNLDAMFDRNEAHRPTIGLQLLLYALLAEQEGNTLYEPCIFGAREIWTAAPAAKAIPEGIREEFLTRLTALIAEIFDPGVPFDAQTTDAKRCENCPFIEICKS